MTKPLPIHDDFSDAGDVGGPDTPLSDDGGETIAVSDGEQFARPDEIEMPAMDFSDDVSDDFGTDMNNDLGNDFGDEPVSDISSDITFVEHEPESMPEPTESVGDSSEFGEFS